VFTDFQRVIFHLDEESSACRTSDCSTPAPAEITYPDSRLSAKWIDTVLDRCEDNVNCISEGGTEPHAQDMEKLNRLTAESWRKRAPWSLGSFQKRCFAEGFTA